MVFSVTFLMTLVDEARVYECRGIRPAEVEDDVRHDVEVVFVAAFAFRNQPVGQVLVVRPVQAADADPR